MVIEMIRNIIFDLGNVLINFKPIKFMERFTNDSEHIRNFAKKVFWSDTWLNMDRGVLSWDDSKNIFQTQHPEEAPLLELLFSNWKEILTPIENNIQILKDLKQKGYNIFVLSNYIEKPFEYTKNQNDFFSLLDGMVISYQENYVKPERQIYQILLDRYNLIPNESISFIFLLLIII